MRQLVLYGIVGALTTAINIVAYWFLTRVLECPVVMSTVIAWLVALLFAYWANRKYVFESHSAEILKEASEFFFARVTTGVLDVIIMYIFVDVLGYHDVWIKTASNILVIILNYIFSKLIIFKPER